MYERLSGSCALADTTIFLLDEFGGLPEGDPGRCDSMIDHFLLEGLAARPTFHAPSVDPPDPEGYQRLIDDGGLDLALLGLGGNGHIGMNEPGSEADSPTRVVELARSTSDHAAEYGASAKPTWGVTLGMRSILEAGEVWLMVTGAHKRDILRTALEGPVDPEVPASLLREHPRFRVLADESAAGA